MSRRYYLAAAGIMVLVFFLLRKEKAEKRIAASLLAAYLFLVLGSTVFRRSTRTRMLYRPELFWTYRVIAQNGIRKSGYMISQVILNILLLSPIGFLMPVFVKKKRWVILVFGFLFSLLIETLQLVLRRGYFEADDLFHNTLGVAIACGLVEMWERLWKRLNI